MKNELKKLKMSKTIKGIATSNEYIGYYEQDISCKKYKFFELIE
jgi:hypothetical protein